MSNIVVTGGTGFIGCHLINRLIKDDNTIFVLVRSSSIIPDNWMRSGRIQVIPCDSPDFSRVKNSICKADVFVHLAWDGSSGEKRNDLSIQISNLIFSIQCFNLAIELRCQKMIVAGTVSEYLAQSQPEDATYYARMKSILCTIVSNLRKMACMEVVWARLSTVYGKDNDSGNLMSYIFAQHCKRELPTFAEGEQILDFIYVEDAIEIIRLIIYNQSNIQEISIVSCHPMTLTEYIDIIDNIFNTDYKKGIGMRPGSKCLNKREWFVETKIKDVLHYEFKKTFRDRMIAMKEEL